LKGKTIGTGSAFTSDDGIWNRRQS